MIHPSAIVHPGAKLAAGVSVGPYSIIGEHVEVGEGTTIGSHVVIEGWTRIGKDNRILAHSVLGGAPQDKKYAGEATGLEIGDRNLIREFCTFNCGTVQDARTTRIGSDNWIMAYVHIAHDCTVGDHTIFSNNATLAGHVEVGDYAILSGFSGVHQFCRVGEHAFIGMGCLINGDVPPFVIVANEYGRPRGINSEGLKRRGFSPERIAAIKRAYKTLYVSRIPLDEARAELARIAADEPDVKRMLDFIERGQRALMR